MIFCAPRFVSLAFSPILSIEGQQTPSSSAQSASANSTINFTPRYAENLQIAVAIMMLIAFCPKAGEGSSDSRRYSSFCENTVNFRIRNTDGAPESNEPDLSMQQPSANCGLRQIQRFRGLSTLRAILRKHRLWANIQPDVKMLRVADDVGRAIDGNEEACLLEACRASRSRSLYPAVTLALNTCTRYSELRLLRWKQVDLVGQGLTVGKSKTDAGEGRFIPLNSRAVSVLSWWAAQFPNRLPGHCVFPSEHYGAAGDQFTACVYKTDPMRPIGR